MTSRYTESRQEEYEAQSPEVEGAESEGFGGDSGQQYALPPNDQDFLRDDSSGIGLDNRPGAYEEGDPGTTGLEEVSDGYDEEPPLHEQAPQPRQDQQGSPGQQGQEQRTYTAEEVARIQSALDRRFAEREQQWNQQFQQLQAQALQQADQSIQQNFAGAAQDYEQHLTQQYAAEYENMGYSPQEARNRAAPVARRQAQAEAQVTYQQQQLAAQQQQTAQQQAYQAQAMQAELKRTAAQLLGQEYGVPPEALMGFGTGEQMEAYAQAANIAMRSRQANRRRPMRTGDSAVPGDTLPINEQQLIDRFTNDEASDEEAMQAMRIMERRGLV